MNSEQYKYIFTVVKSCNYLKCCVIQPLNIVYTLNIATWKAALSYRKFFYVWEIRFSSSWCKILNYWFKFSGTRSQFSIGPQLVLWLPCKEVCFILNLLYLVLKVFTSSWYMQWLKRNMFSQFPEVRFIWFISDLKCSDLTAFVVLIS